MKPLFLLAACISMCTAKPGPAKRQNGCPASYAACPRFNDVLAYCYDLLSGPVYGWPGSAIGNAEGPKPYTSASIHLNTPYLTTADVGCVCNAQSTTPTGWDAALKCYFCEIPNMDAPDIALYQALMERWVMTCDTWGLVDVQSALKCWNTDLEEGCWQPAS